MEHIQLKNVVPNGVEAITGEIAHEFNNLLAAMKTPASLMMNYVQPSDPLYRHIKEIIHCIDKGSEFANQLLGFATIDEYYTSAIDVNALVRNIAENLDIKGEKIILDVDLDSKVLMVEADPDKIKQVLMSIIDNAVFAMPDGGKISIATESAVTLNGTTEAYGFDTEFFVKITIIDTGIGMEKEVLESIFMPFYSVNHDCYPEKRGLGLTFAREIVWNHNGVIDVWSFPDKGSSFSIILPLKENIDK
jgi:signal transduction histidine kinase